MQTVYEAANMLEAHMVAGMLDQQGIAAWVLGDMLQGAIGEVPAGSLARVTTRAEDADRARDIIREWEQQQPAPTGPAPDTTLRSLPRQWPAFLLGMLTGMLVMAWMMQ